MSTPRKVFKLVDGKVRELTKKELIGERSKKKKAVGQTKGAACKKISDVLGKEEGETGTRMQNGKQSARHEKDQTVSFDGDEIPQAVYPFSEVSGKSVTFVKKRSKEAGNKNQSATAERESARSPTLKLPSKVPSMGGLSGTRSKQRKPRKGSSKEGPFTGHTSRQRSLPSSLPGSPQLAACLTKKAARVSLPPPQRRRRRRRHTANWNKAGPDALEERLRQLEEALLKIGKAEAQEAKTSAAHSSTIPESKVPTSPQTAAAAPAPAARAPAPPPPAAAAAAAEPAEPARAVPGPLATATMLLLPPDGDSPGGGGGPDSSPSGGGPGGGGLGPGSPGGGGGGGARAGCYSTPGGRAASLVGLADLAAATAEDYFRLLLSPTAAAASPAIHGSMTENGTIISKTEATTSAGPIDMINNQPEVNVQQAGPEGAGSIAGQKYSLLLVSTDSKKQTMDKIFASKVKRNFLRSSDDDASSSSSSNDQHSFFELANKSEETWKDTLPDKHTSMKDGVDDACSLLLEDKRQAANKFSLASNVRSDFSINSLAITSESADVHCLLEEDKDFTHKEGGCNSDVSSAVLTCEEPKEHTIMKDGCQTLQIQASTNVTNNKIERVSHGGEALSSGKKDKLLEDVVEEKAEKTGPHNKKQSENMEGAGGGSILNDIDAILRKIGQAEERSHQFLKQQKSYHGSSSSVTLCSSK